jgi:hypothetical protein
MATTGSVDVNLTKFGDMINNSSDLGAEVTGGVADQGALIGLAVGLSIALVLLFGVIFLMYRQMNSVIGTSKRVGK